MTSKLKFLNGLIMTAVLPAMSFAASLDSRVDSLEQTVMQSTTKNDLGGMGARNASALPSTDNTGWHAEIGFIYEQPRVGGTLFAIKKSATGSGQTKSTRQTVKQDPKWAWGLNIGVGYKGFEYWDCEINYTYFKNSASTSAGAGFGGTVAPTKTQFDLVSSATPLTDVTSAKSDLNVELSSFDATVGNIYFTQKFFSTGIKAGLRSQWLSLKQNSSYTGGSVLGNNSAYVNDKSRYWGIGPVLTLANEWFVGRGFSFFINNSLSALYSKFKVTQNQTYSADETAGYSISDYVNSVLPELDVNLGIGYGSYFANRKQYLSLKLGWDFHYFFGANQSLQNSDSYITSGSTVYSGTKVFNQNADFSMQGLMLTVRWDF